MRRPEVRPGFIILCALACLLLPEPLFWPLLSMGALHEAGHLAALSLCAVPVEGLQLGFFGAVIGTGTASPGREAICALAGPAVNLFAFLALRRAWPGAAVVSLALGACNLLPLRPLDGGRALSALLLRLLPLPTAMGICGAVEALTLSALGIGALCLCRRFGPLPAILFALLLANRARERNFLLPSGRFPDIMKKTSARGVRHDRQAPADPPHGPEAGPIRGRGVQRRHQK